MSFYTPLTINLFTDTDAYPPIYEDLVAEAMAKINENFGSIDDAINTALNGLDPQNSVTSKSLSAAPTTGLTVGARYIVAATPGAGDPWEGHAGDIAELTATTPAYAWEFITPNKGFNLTVEDENLEYIYTGLAWASRPSVEQHNQLGGLQGGSSDERYHVSAASATGLAAGYLPTSGEKAALAGTTGTPGGANQYVTTTDPRLLTDAEVDAITGMAGEALTQYDVVYCNYLDGKYYKATTSGAPQALEVAGIVMAAGLLPGDSGLIALSPGVLTNAEWAMTKGRPQWLGVDGVLTEIKPVENAVYVGTAASATSLMFLPARPEQSLVLDINADQLELKYSPANYSPSLTPGTTALEQLASHIHALDLLIGPLSAASATPTRNIIPLADNYGTLDAWVTVGNLLLMIAADQLKINYAPTGYTPTGAPSASELGDLATHLAGIDAALNGILARLTAHSI